MPDAAVVRLRGILAATMTRTAIDQLLAQVAAEQRTADFAEGAGLLDSVLGDNLHLTSDWDWWDAATIPASCATLLRHVATTPADQPIPYTLADAEGNVHTVPGRPTPRLIRDLVEGARTQGQRCPERTRAGAGKAVTCVKTPDHPGPWHRNGRHVWKTIHADLTNPNVPVEPAATEPKTLRTVAADLRAALREIRSASRQCTCPSNKLAHAALTSASTPST